MNTIKPILELAKSATHAAASLSNAQKEDVLQLIASQLLENAAAIIAENAKDLEKMADDDPKKDRLMLNVERIRNLALGVRAVSLLPTPSENTLREITLDNGLHIQKRAVPLGVVGVIYEARPNVTVDVASLCIRSGNVCVLRGGSDAYFTNIYLVKLLRKCLHKCGILEDIVQLLPVERRFVQEMLTAKKYVDMVIPRGSQKLIDFVRDNAKVPVIETGAGVCHTYVDETADLDIAAKIITNAKVTRPSVCNALDTIVVDRNVAAELLPKIAKSLTPYEVEIYADSFAFSILRKENYPFLKMATLEDFGREFLALKCSIKVVANADEAIQHIESYSSKHSEAIISKDPNTIARFMNEVDAAVVYSNASTRFTDGGEFGLGAEIGISTQKLHARGPFALEKLFTEKWFVTGSGQVRE